MSGFETHGEERQGIFVLPPLKISGGPRHSRLTPGEQE
jgi:hypothetical protein